MSAALAYGHIAPLWQDIKYIHIKSTWILDMRFNNVADGRLRADIGGSFWLLSTDSSDRFARRERLLGACTYRRVNCVCLGKPLLLNSRYARDSV